MLAIVMGTLLQAAVNIQDPSCMINGKDACYWANEFANAVENDKSSYRAEFLKVKLEKSSYTKKTKTLELIQKVGVSDAEFNALINSPNYTSFGGYIKAFEAFSHDMSCKKDLPPEELIRAKGMVIFTLLDPTGKAISQVTTTRCDR